MIACGLSQIDYSCRGYEMEATRRKYAETDHTTRPIVLLLHVLLLSCCTTDVYEPCLFVAGMATDTIAVYKSTVVSHAYLSVS